MKRLLMLGILLCLATFALATTVYEIQYTTDAGDGTYPSPLDNQDVSLSNVIVTAVSGSKFYVTDSEGGAWHGVYVFAYSDQVPNPPSVGDVVSFDAEVDEYYGLTELKNVANFTVTGTATVPDPEVILTGDMGEAYEGVLVRVEDVTVTQEPDSHGEWYCEDEAGGEVQIDDNFGFTVPGVEVGATFDFLQGIGDYGFNLYGISPRDANDISTEIVYTEATIAEIQANPSNYDYVKITGVVTMGVGILHNTYTKAYIQDESGKGINIFSNSSLIESLIRGNEVQIKGSVTEYYGITEIMQPEDSLLSTGNDLPAAQELTLAQAQDTDTWEGTYIQISGTIVDTSIYETAENFVLVEGTDTVVVRIHNTTGIDYSGFEIGDTMAAKGILGVHFDAPQVWPGYIGEVWEEGGTPAENVAVQWQNTAQLTNYPNPFNPETTIEFSIQNSQNAELNIYNLKGQLVQQFANLHNGHNSILWNGQNTAGKDVASGIYFYQLKADGQNTVKKMVLMK